MFSQGCEIRIWQWCGFEPTISEWRANPYDYLHVHKYSKFRRTNQSFPIWKEIPPNWDFFPSSRVVKAFATLVNGPSFVRSFVGWLQFPPSDFALHLLSNVESGNGIPLYLLCVYPIFLTLPPTSFFPSLFSLSLLSLSLSSCYTPAINSFIFLPSICPSFLLSFFLFLWLHNSSFCLSLLISLSINMYLHSYPLST